jgi:hypothetical protein
MCSMPLKRKLVCQLVYVIQFLVLALNLNEKVEKLWEECIAVIDKYMILINVNSYNLQLHEFHYLKNLCYRLD